MKTRTLIIIIVVIVISSVMSLSYYTIYDSSTTVFISCTPKHEKIGDKCVPLKPEQYCKDWCDLEGLSKLGCTELALDYVFMATNLFDEDFGDVYYRNFVGLSNGLSEEEFETCADIIKEKRAEYDLNNHDSNNVSEIGYLLEQAEINYLPDRLVVTGGPTIRGDPGCGVVIDTDAATHWFGIDSISEPKKITLYSENPNQCKVNTTSCFCNAQRKLTALTLDELSYFTLQEEEKYAEILIDYLGNENINRTPKFQIGKFNLNYTDSSVVGYCGELWGTNTYDFFEGAFVKDVVEDYSIDKELSPLCAISDDAKWWERK
jgi:hypothetical protein